MRVVLTWHYQSFPSLAAHHRHRHYSGISELYAMQLLVILTKYSTAQALRLAQLIVDSAGPAHRWSLLLLWLFPTWIVATAHFIMAVSDGQSYMTSYLSCKLLMKWSFIPYICNSVYPLPHPQASLCRPDLISDILSYSRLLSHGAQ
jgi:hypothetical protein